MPINNPGSTRVGSSVLNGTANQILYVNSSGILSQSSGLVYNDSIIGGGEEYLFGLNNTFSLGSQGEGSTLALSSNILTLNDTKTFNNDGTNDFTNSYCQQRVSGTVNQSGAVAGINHYGHSVSIYNPATYTINGSSDLSIWFAGYYSNVNIGNLSVPTAGDDPVITINGAHFNAISQLSKDAGANPYLELNGVRAVASRTGGTNPNLCRGGTFSATNGTLNYGIQATASGGTTSYGVHATGTTGAVYADGNIILNDAKNFSFGTSSGTKIGTATSQKLAFWNATPIIQPTTGIAAATRVGGGGTTITTTDTFDGYTIAQLAKVIRNIGLAA